jgi:DNA-binding transcriptional regulator YdaS (Cro superfamily)
MIRPQTKEVKRAIKAAGGVTALAEAIGTSKQAVGQWYMIPLARVWDVEKATGIPHQELRPDFFGKSQK